MPILKQTEAMFWSSKLKAGKMGAFTCYDIEYVAKFLGYDRIQDKIKELEGKPTMGTPFKEFFEREVYYTGTGVLHILWILLGYFKDDDLAEFLFEKSHSYNYENYYDGKNIRKNWEESIKTYKIMIERGEDKAYYRYKMSNQYWIDYHFFIHGIVEILYKPNTKPLNYPLLDEIFSEYYSHLETITTQIKASDLWPEHGLGNAILSKMANFYKKQGFKDRYDEIENRGIGLGWRV